MYRLDRINFIVLSQIFFKWPKLFIVKLIAWTRTWEMSDVFVFKIRLDRWEFFALGRRKSSLQEVPMEKTKEEKRTRKPARTGEHSENAGLNLIGLF